MTRLEWIQRRSKWIGRECLPWPFSHSSWYHTVAISAGKYSQAHRVMCEAAYGPPPFPSAMALHSCNNKWCVNPQHLRWGTPQENGSDRVLDGASRRGETHPAAKITEEQVRAAKSDRLNGLRYDEIANKYGVTKGSIWHAINGSQWSHVK